MAVPTPMNWKRFGRLLVLACGVVLMLGCGSAPPLLRGNIVAAAGTNPDARGRPSPVVVRVYELRAVTAFNSADFFSLFEREQETLGGELVGREEYHLNPSEKRPYQRQLQPDTKFIGVIAAFRDIENSLWRSVAPAPTKRRATVTIGVEAAAVTLAVQ